MFIRFEQQHHFDHLLWVYSPHVVRSSTRSALHFYPGDSYVDITALDAYDGPEMLAGYQELIALKKPCGLGEFGPPENERDGTFDNRRLIESIRRTHPRSTFVLFWNSWQDQRVALIDNRHARELMADTWVVTREQLQRQRHR